MFFAENDITLELLGVFKLTRGAGRHQSCDRRHHSLAMRTRGSGHFLSDGKTHQVKTGDLLYMPHTVSYTQSTDGESLIAIHFLNYSRSVDTQLTKITLDDYAECEQLMRNMYAVWNEKKPGYKHECTSMLYHLLYLVRQQLHDQVVHAVSPNEQLASAIGYIHENYKKEQISVTQLAKMSSVSESYFRRLFREICGVSPNRYIINLRLEYASQLLQSQLYTVAEVGEKSGFSDIKYFSRLFKKQYHVTPHHYKKQNVKSVFF